MNGFLAKRRTKTKRKTSMQRETIRALYAKHGDDKERISADFEKAALAGKVTRVSNPRNQSWRHYARFLLDKGKREGWIY